MVSKRSCLPAVAMAEKPYLENINTTADQIVVENDLED